MLCDACVRVRHRNVTCCIYSSFLARDKIFSISESSSVITVRERLKNNISDSSAVNGSGSAHDCVCLVMAAASLERRLAERRAKKGANAQTMFPPATVGAKYISWIRGAAHLPSSDHKCRLKTASSRVELNSRRKGRRGKNEAKTCHKHPRGLNAETKSTVGRATDLPGDSAVSAAMNAASGAR